MAGFLNRQRRIYIVQSTLTKHIQVIVQPKPNILCNFPFSLFILLLLLSTRFMFDFLFFLVFHWYTCFFSFLFYLYFSDLMKTFPLNISFGVIYDCEKQKKYEFSFLPFVSRALEQAIKKESYKTRHFHL